MTVTNTSGVTAYDAVVGDLIPAGMSYVPGSISIVSGPVGTPDDTSAPDLHWAFSAIAPGQTAVVSFEARIDTAAATPLANIGTLTWTSTLGPKPRRAHGCRRPAERLLHVQPREHRWRSSAYQNQARLLIAPAGGLAGVNDPTSFSIVHHQHGGDDAGDGAADRQL